MAGSPRPSRQAASGTCSCCRTAGTIPGRLSTSIAVGIIWPSLLFPDDDPATAKPVPSTGHQLAAALGPAFPQQQQNIATLGQLLGQQASITGDTAAVFGHSAAMSKTPTDNAESIPNPFTTLWSGAREVLRSMSYYEMKNRAGVIGRNGLGPLLGK